MFISIIYLIILAYPADADPRSIVTFDCDFEYGTCGWTQSTTDDIDWIVEIGLTPTQGTGPNGDHTLDGAGECFL